MPYGIVACPSCRKAKGYALGVKTTQCHLCGRKLDVERLVTVVAADETELARLIGETNARLASASADELETLRAPPPERAPPSDALAAVVRAARGVSGEVPKADATARALTDAYGEFTEAQLREALDTVGVAAARTGAHLKRMLVGNVVYEPRPGAYRAL